MTDTTQTKLFSLHQANAMLPLVKTIVADIMELSKVVTQTHERLNSIGQRTGRSKSESYSDEIREIEFQLSQDVDQLNEYIRELSELGVEMKGLSQGLVDFPAMHRGQIVNLCWKYGEEQITHWHTLESGFAGRQLILDEDFVD